MVTNSGHLISLLAFSYHAATGLPVWRMPRCVKTRMLVLNTTKGTVGGKPFLLRLRRTVYCAKPMLSLQLQVVFWCQFI
jgi:hypothetical protein